MLMNHTMAQSIVSNGICNSGSAARVTLLGSLVLQQALQAVADKLKELRVRNATSLSQRSLLQLSVFRELEVLELKNCGKISWCELQEAWRLACATYEAQMTEAFAAATGSGVAATYTRSSLLGGWLPGGGRLSRTSSPSGSTIVSALAKQKSGGGAASAFLASWKNRGNGCRATAAAQLGKGAVGNGRSSSGGGSQDSVAIKKFLHRKQKLRSAATEAASGEISASYPDPADGQQMKALELPYPALVSSTTLSAGAPGDEVKDGNWALQQQQQPPGAQHFKLTIPSTGSANQSPPLSPTSALYRVGSLVWQGTTAAAAALSSSSVARQSSAVQTALMAYLAEAEAGANPLSPSAGCAIKLDRARIPKSTANSCLENAAASGSNGASATSRFGPSRRRPSCDKPLPGMPFTRLTSLSFTCSEATYKRPGPELEAIASLTTLTCLELGKCKLPDSVFWRLGSLTRLNRLKLSDLWSMGDEGLAELAKLTNLKSLSLSEAMHVTSAGLQLLSRLTGLTALALGLTQDLGPGAIAQVAFELRGLKCLEVTASCWGDLDCEHLAGAAAEACLAAVAADDAGLPAPVMLWNVPRSTSPLGGSVSKSNSSRMLSSPVPGPLSACSSRSNSSLNLGVRPASISSLPSFGSFSSFVMPASSTLIQRSCQPQQLAVLKLHGCCSLGHRGLAALKQLKHLQSLTLDNCKEVHAAEIISQDLLPPKLQSLTLKSMPFGNAFSSCVNVPACAGSLTKLELSAVSAVHSGQLRHIINSFHNLVELSLAGSLDVGDAAVKQLVLLKLQHLNLAGVCITNHSMEQLMHLPELTALCLKGCNLITDAGLFVLPMYPALQEIDLSECTGVSQRGLKTVMQAVYSLVRLDLRGCKAVTRELLQCCPHYVHVRHTA